MPGYLTARSGLPGPRGNLELADAFGDVADADLIRRLATDEDEYLRFCGVVGLGRLLADGDADAGRLRATVAGWVRADHPLVRRAAIAAICEPRLLRDPTTAVAALDACAEATAGRLATPASDRRHADVRTLRQALGYCWSVAIAADPVRGLEAFAALRTLADPDAAWVIRENLRKARLQLVLAR